MRRIVCVVLSLIIAIFIIGCSGSESSTEKSKFEVMADVLNAIGNAGMDESGYNQRSMGRSIEGEGELNDQFGPETYEIAPGFSVTINGSINFTDTEINITFSADSTLTNYSSDGYILNGNLDETATAIITSNDQEITGMTEELIIDGTIEFSGKETGSFSFNNLTISFVIDPQTGNVTSTNVSGTVTFNDQDVTSELIAELQAV
ncbi:MAG: hypothetical protein QHH74_06345 [Spirochaetota bacterium]|nr:hypothetical protein [Spirochaetota bacterium]